MNYILHRIICVGLLLITVTLSYSQDATPQLERDFVKLRQNYTQYIDVLSNDESNGSLLTIEKIALVNQGSAEIYNNKILFTPQSGYFGRAFIKYIACDEAGNCANQDVHIYIPHSSELIAHDTVKQFSLKGSPAYFFLPLSNLNITQQPDHGTVDYKSEFAIEYIPQEDFVGFDTIRCAWGNMMTRVFVVEVIPNPPSNGFAKNDLLYVATNVDVEVDINISNEVIEIPGYYSFTDYSNVKNHTFGQDEQGLLLDNGSGQVTYYPPNNYEGVQSFDYTACNEDTCETGTIFLQVGTFKPRNKEPYQFKMAKGNILVIDYDIPIAPAVFSLERASFPANGDVAVYSEADLPTLNCGANIVGENLIVYEPLPTFVGTDQFSIEYCLDNNPCAPIQIIVEVVDEEAPCNFVDEPVWPGDLNASGRVDMGDLLTLGWTLGEVGPARYGEPDTWLGQSSDPWETTFEDVDYKHIDADGDGMISDQDLDLVNQNYGLAHKLVPEIPPLPKDIPLFIEPVQAVLDSGDLAEIDIKLGLPERPALDVHGFTFALDIYNGLVDSNSVMVNFEQYSWLIQNAPHLELTQQPSANRIEAGVTRANQKSLSGHGIVSKVGFVIREDIVGFRASGNRIPVQIHMHDIIISGADGQEYQLPDQFATLYLNVTPNSRPTTEKDLVVFPNPTSDRLRIHLNGYQHMIQEVNLFNIHGQQIKQIKDVQNKQLQIDVHTLPTGMYILRVNTSKGIITKKIEVQR